MSVRRLRLVAAVAVAAAGLTACGAAPGPGDPTTSATPSSTADPTGSGSPSSSAGSPSPTATGSGAPTTSSSPTGSPTTATRGLTLRQLGFSNGPEEFSLPTDLVLATRVDQPNVVTLVLARPSPETVEDYLRATLPGSGFTIDARADTGQAMTFVGHGWTGAFTGTGSTTAIVLRPA